jgi:hypothetical protein
MSRNVPVHDEAEGLAHRVRRPDAPQAEQPHVDQRLAHPELHDDERGQGPRRRAPGRQRAARRPPLLSATAADLDRPLLDLVTALLGPDLAG